MEAETAFLDEEYTGHILFETESAGEDLSKHCISCIFTGSCGAKILGRLFSRQWCGFHDHYHEKYFCPDGICKKKIGKDATIMLAEQAFNSTQGEELQAATYAYAYYISEGNKMIESFIYARDTEPQSDVDQGFYWGLPRYQWQRA